MHGFRNSVQGNIAEETGEFTKFDTQYDSIVAGLNIRYGGKHMRERPRPGSRPSPSPRPIAGVAQGFRK